MQKPIPNKIYLQIKDELGNELCERTWCEDKIYDSDICYIRQSIVEGIIKAEVMRAMEGKMT